MSKEIKDLTKQEIENQINGIQCAMEHCFGINDLNELDLLYQEANRRGYEVKSRTVVELVESEEEETEG